MGKKAVSPDSIIKLSAPETNGYWEIQILYEDEYILALNKPACLLTSPDRYDPKRPNLMKLLHAGIEEGKDWAKVRNLTYLMNPHRLDFETTGVILLAKSKDILTMLTNQFSENKTRKMYLAIAHGAPPKDEFTVEVRIAPNPKKPEIMRVVRKKGKQTITHFKVLEKFAGYTLFECHPVTGRTHQIRVHLKYAGCPIVGDILYGGLPLYLSQLKPDFKKPKKGVEKPIIDTVALHSKRLEFVHPVTGNPVCIEAPEPKPFLVALKYLREYASAAPSVQVT
jgi:RluA family pseudouridine synthase